MQRRDYKLWRLILRKISDSGSISDIHYDDSAGIVHNAILLFDGGYIDGEPWRDSSGCYAGIRVPSLTNKGHDLLVKLDSENGNTNTQLLMTPNPPVSVFISHSAKDEKLAAALVALLRSALNIPADKIRCTSVNGYRLPAGAETEVQLRQEVHDAKAFIGLITPSSMASAYVMFELGARWGAHLHLVPLLGAGAGSELLRGPLASLNALNCEDAAQVHQLMSDLSDVLAVQDATRPAVYEELITKLVETSKAGRSSGQALPLHEHPNRQREPRRARNE